MRKLLVLTLVFSLFGLVPIRQTHAQQNMQCTEYTARVRISAGALTTYPLVGTLCYSGSLQGKSLQLTVHGITYSRNYFDFSYNDYEYSYLRYAVDQGYAVFNIDRVGNGESGHPNGAFVDLQASAYTIHQLIQKLRNGTLTGHQFEQIVYVGHSYGSFVGVELAAEYPDDVDGLVLTGYLHNVNPEALLVAPTALIPTQLDPKFGFTFPLGYLTTAAGMRDELFYNTDLADLNVIMQDEVEKDVFSVTTLDDILLATLSHKSENIHKPVQIVIGENDFIFCGGSVNCSDGNAIINHEANFFAPSAQLEVNIVPDAGHDLNLHTNFLTTYSEIHNWIYTKI